LNQKKEIINIIINKNTKNTKTLLGVGGPYIIGGFSLFAAVLGTYPPRKAWDDCIRLSLHHISDRPVKKRGEMGRQVGY
jgi:hypothetical protein